MKFFKWMLLFLAFCAFPAMADSLLDKISVAEYLPKDTDFFIATGNLKELTGKMGRERLIEKYRKYYDQMVAEVKGETGHNLLAPEGLGEIGIEVGAPTGFAFLDIDPEVFVFFTGLSDPGKFRSFIQEMSQKHGGSFQSENVGNAVILYDRPEGGTYMILRDEYFFMLGVNYDMRKQGVELAKKFAQIDKSESLANDSVYQNIAENVQFGPDTCAYFNVASIVENRLNWLKTKIDGPAENYARDRIEELKKEEVAKEELDYWRQAAKEEDKWQKKLREQRKTEYQMIETYFTSINGIALEGRLDERSAQIKAYASFKPSSFLIGLLKNGDGAPVLFNSVEELPISFASGVADPKAIADFIDSGMKADGNDDFDEFKEILQKEFNMDFENDLLSLFTGEVAIAFTGNLNFQGKRDEEIFKDVGVSAALRVSDPERARSVLSRFASYPEIKDVLGKNLASGDYAVPVPDWKELYVNITGDYLTVSDKAGFNPQAKGKSFVGRYDNPDLRKLLRIPDPAAVWIMDMQISASALISGMSDAKCSSACKESTIAKDISDVPYSKEYEEKQREIEKMEKQRDEDCDVKRREIEKLRVEIDKIDLEVNTKRNEALIKMMRRFGQIALVAKIESGGLAVYGGQYFNADSAYDLIALTIDDMLEAENVDAKYSNRQSELYEQIWQKEQEIEKMRGEYQEKIQQLEDELRSIRDRDIEKHYEK